MAESECFFFFFHVLVGGGGGGESPFLKMYIL